MSTRSQETPTTSAPPPAPRHPLSRRKKLLFTFVTLLLLATLAEGALRVAARARAAPQLRGEATEIYVIGGSTARGEPIGPELGIGPWVGAMLGDTAGTPPVRTHVLAAAGESLYPQVEKLRALLPYRNRDNPAVVLIYSGHNERMTPDDVREWERRGRPAGTTFRQWATAHFLLFNELRLLVTRHYEEGRQRDMQHYGHQLRRAVELAREAGATPILSTVVSNLGGVEPSLRDGRRSEARRLLANGMQAEQRGDFQAAIDAYARVEREAPWLAPIARFRGAQNLRRLGRFDEAAEQFLSAQTMTESAHYGRAQPAQNQQIRDLSVELEVPLVDAESIFAGHHPDGIIDSRLFADGHHPNLLGYHLLARAFAREVASALDRPLQSPDLGPHEWTEQRSRQDRDILESHIRSAVWLFSTSIEHPFPDAHLKLAGEHVTAALALDPASDRTLLVQGLVTAAREHDLLAESADEEWVRENRLIWQDLEDCTDSRQAAAAAAKFETLGMEPRLVAAMKDAAARLPEHCQPGAR